MKKMNYWFTDWKSIVYCKSHVLFDIFKVKCEYHFFLLKNLYVKWNQQVIFWLFGFSFFPFFLSKRHFSSKSGRSHQKGEPKPIIGHFESSFLMPLLWVNKKIPFISIVSLLRWFNIEEIRRPIQSKSIEFRF